MQLKFKKKHEKAQMQRKNSNFGDCHSENANRQIPAAFLKMAFVT
jgi:hypothetical protein